MWGYQLQVTCRLLGVILEETTPEELQVGTNASAEIGIGFHGLMKNSWMYTFLQNHVTVRPSVLEVLLEIAKFCDVYLMERILDDESGVGPQRALMLSCYLCFVPVTGTIICIRNE
jgi:hypothetical protein